MNSELQNQIQQAIAHSRLISHVFTAGECILLHLWANQNIEPSPELQSKFKELYEFIETTDWTKPKLKYTENYDLYYECPDTFNWKKITINN